MERIALVAVTDLLFQTRIDAALRALGLAPRHPGTRDDALREAAAAAVVVIDLHDAVFDAAATIAAAKAAGRPVLAFGRHTDAAALRAARAAGADAVVARSQLVEDLPRLVAALTGATPHAG